MSTGLDTQTLSAVFQSRPDILDGIQKAAGMSKAASIAIDPTTRSALSPVLPLARSLTVCTDTPARVSLFNNIASFVYEQLSNTGDEHATKRRRVDISSVNGHASSQANGGATGGVDAAAADPVLLEIKDISLSVPAAQEV